MDGYYKQRENQLDDGLFGQTLILSAFNYAKGGFTAWNSPPATPTAGSPRMPMSPSREAQGKDWSSAQFLFDPTDAGLCQKPLDRSGSRPARDRLLRRVLHLEGRHRGGTRVYVDALYGSGLHQDGPATIPGDPDNTCSKWLDRSVILPGQCWRGTKFQCGQRQNSESPAGRREPHRQHL